MISEKKARQVIDMLQEKAKIRNYGSYGFVLQLGRLHAYNHGTWDGKTRWEIYIPTEDIFCQVIFCGDL